MDEACAKALSELLAIIGVERRDTGGAIRIHGSDPVLASPNRYGTATAAALAAQGAAIAAIWKRRSGVGQDVDVDLAQAVHHGLRSVFLLRQNGHPFVVGTPGVNNYFRTRDGRHLYCVRMGDYPHLTPNLIGFLRCANTSEAVAAAIGQWLSSDIEDAMAAARIPAVITRTEAEWLAHPQGRLLAVRPGVEIDRLASSPPEPLCPATRPLAGVRVLDLSHVIAGPATARTLAEQGADVLRISAPHQPDPVQMVMDLGFGKRSAFLNLDRPEDAEHLRRLVAEADIVIDSWRPGALARRGFSPQDLAAIRPGIIVVSLSAYGSEGPWAARGGYEPIGQAASGLSVAEGGIESPRNAPTGTMNDYLAAYLACAGALGALLRRAQHGGSHHVKTSLTQSSMWVLRCGQLGAKRPLPAPFALPGLASMDSPFGRLDHTPPVTRYSVTSAHWALPPQPFGASLPEWQPRAAAHTRLSP
jgi:crotonobetainyl-CoA:carnitine CoA-transferase CaiB-like acyl-CoA transferase